MNRMHYITMIDNSNSVENIKNIALNAKGALNNDDGCAVYRYACEKIEAITSFPKRTQYGNRSLRSRRYREGL